MTRMLFFLCCWWPLLAGAQTLLQGRLLDTEGLAVTGGQVLIKEMPNLATRSDSLGQYQLRLPRGRWTVVAFALGYQLVERPVEGAGDSLTWEVRLEPLSFEADAVALEAARTRAFGLRRLGDVEEFGIFAARKTEVIPMAAVQANKATNNAREAFARVAGLNIWESDCGGLQLGLGGRGLSPGRSAHFNLRQDGVDIAAEAIGYPESYYSPPLQAVDRVEIVRGAASLQYGPQFGGLVNFVLHEGPTDRKAQVRSAQTLGSFGLFNSFNSLGGQLGPVNYYGYFQYKRGDCWRCNSSFEQQQGYLGLRLRLGHRASLRLSHTRMRYLAQQAGGLTDRLFAEDARQALRARNWFAVQWDLPAAQLDWRLARQWALQVRAFGLVAQRDALGRLDRINVTDLGGPRDLIQDRFRNLGAEVRLRHRLAFRGDTATVLAGLRGYATHTVQRQGLGNADSTADFTFLNLDGPEAQGIAIPPRVKPFTFDLPNRNAAAFVEAVLPLGGGWTLSPGLRYEYLRTQVAGHLRSFVFDFAGNVVADTTETWARAQTRTLLLAGLGLSYRPGPVAEFYANVAQNFRPVLFNDMRLSNPNLVVDENLRDERGYNADLGVRGHLRNLLYFDFTLFYLRYNDQIGTVLRADQPPLFLDYQYRTNVADSRTIGLESLLELNLLALLGQQRPAWQLSLFSNATLLDGRYVNTDDRSILGRARELVPPLIWRTGLQGRYRRWEASLLYAYVHQHFTDATNAPFSATAVVGVVPAYYVMDAALRYRRQGWGIEAGINNLTDHRYFTRRATAYPGPGIIPAEGRSLYLTAEVVF